MRVGIDICRLTDPWTGVGNYIINLLAGLAQADSQNQYYLYPYFWECFPRDIKGLAQYLPQQENFIFWGDRRSELGAKLFWAKLRLHSERLLAAVDITHSTNLAAPKIKKSKLVVTIHDLSFVRHPEWHKEDNVAFSKRNLTWAVERAQLLVVPSEFTGQELEAFYPGSQGRVRVVPEAVLPQYRPLQETPNLEAARGLREKYGLVLPYFLFVGTLEPRKNIPVLLSAYRQLKKSGMNGFDLVLAGGRGWKCEPILAALEAIQAEEASKKERTGCLRWLGYVPGQDLPALYQNAHALVYPSLYEGFGLPVLEGLACGIPVITSRAASLPEVGGEAVLLVDSSDSQSLAQEMSRLLNDSELGRRLAQAGPKRARKFSQETMGVNTLEVYKELCRES